MSKIVMLIKEVFNKCLLQQSVKAYLRLCKKSYGNYYLNEHLPVIFGRSKIIKQIFIVRRSVGDLKVCIVSYYLLYEFSSFYTWVETRYGKQNSAQWKSVCRRLIQKESQVEIQLIRKTIKVSRPQKWSVHILISNFLFKNLSLNGQPCASAVYEVS